ncbi:MAG: hypothetical protein CMM59_03515 [Rhodospirillaceae bacterium]|nr:hypothetical protein [Rhodospirillaceae bacterium]|tara:strand:- start:52 stop:891 length:840 start_codon:yes stop_codon:yes gene_type:complete
MPQTIVQVSDTHLCEIFPYFADNWQHFAKEMEALKPDLLIHTGDISLSGTMDDQAMRHIRNEIDRLPVQCLAIPGNHDIGTTGGPLKPISEERIGHWQTHFGEDRFAFDIEDWRLIGLNTEILGSGLPSEDLQWVHLETACANAGGREIGIFLHRPLFEKTPDEPSSRWSLIAEPRARLIERLRAHKVRFVASGHLHRYRYISLEGIDLVWCPTTAFVTASTKNDGCIRRVGYLKWTFEGRHVRHEFIEPDGFTNHDMSWREKRAAKRAAIAAGQLAAE